MTRIESKKEGRREYRTALSYFILRRLIGLSPQKRRNLELLIPLVIGEQVVGIVTRRFRLRHRRHGLCRGARRRRRTRLRTGFGAHVGGGFLAAEKAPAAAFLFRCRTGQRLL